ILRPVCLAAGILLWILGGASLALFGQGRESAWYAYHSALTDTDTSAERIGTLPTTITESYAYLFGAKGALTDTVTTEVDFDALSLSAANTETKTPMSMIRGAEPLPEQKTAADKADEKQTDTPQENTEEETPVRPRVNETIDFAALKNMTDKESIRTLCDYFASRKPTTTNEYTGLFKDCDLIWLCCESYAGYALDPEITPTLYKMSREGIVLNNFYNSFPNTTTNGEFAFDTSLWPDVSRSARGGSVSGSFPQSANVFMPYGLGDLFTAAGADCYAYHNYRGTYYMRDLSWLNLGYPDANTKFLGKGMTFTNPWPASDLEMMEQSVDDYIGGGRYHANYMTFSGHGPYDESNYIYRKNIAAVKKLAGDRYKHSECIGYLCGEYELEQAVKYLTDRLEEAGRLENTVIVLIGDHFPYYLSDEAVKEFNGGTMPGQIERNRSSCIIYKAGMEAPVTSDVYCCNVDILPTILNLFDIDYDSRLLMGTDIFSEGVHRARLYNGSFVTDVVAYDRANGKKYWKEAAENRDDATLDAYLEAMLDYTESEYAVSLAMMDNDFYFYVWKNAGIMSAGEVAAEEARQEKGASLYKDRQEQERIEKEEYLRRQQEKEAAEQEAAGGEGAPAGAGEPGAQQGTGEPGQTPAAENAGQPAAPATPAAENAAQPAAQPAAPAAEGAQQPAQ
ncbi:MAG: sulfatase-like hydrolase/transferase, partial [Lachnospiraceae bacterium]|nr:sulfatase-like hydrolase/transferase [Lachnospiraceae bacterium]